MVEQVLSDRNVKFAIFNYKNNQVYPTPQDGINVHLKTNYWNKLKQGKTVRNIQRLPDEDGNPNLRNGSRVNYVYV